MYARACILIVATFILFVSAAPGEKDFPCKVGGFGAPGTRCTRKACGFLLLVPFSRGSCDGGLNCCWGTPPTTSPSAANQPAADQPLADQPTANKPAESPLPANEAIPPAVTA